MFVKAFLCTVPKLKNIFLGNMPNRGGYMLKHFLLYYTSSIRHRVLTFISFTTAPKTQNRGVFHSVTYRHIEICAYLPLNLNRIITKLQPSQRYSLYILLLWISPPFYCLVVFLGAMFSEHLKVSS
jgi:hypothetical protein